MRRASASCSSEGPRLVDPLAPILRPTRRRVGQQGSLWIGLRLGPHAGLGLVGSNTASPSRRDSATRNPLRLVAWSQSPGKWGMAGGMEGSASGCFSRKHGPSETFVELNHRTPPAPREHASRNNIRCHGTTDVRTGPAAWPPAFAHRFIFVSGRRRCRGVGLLFPLSPASSGLRLPPTPPS